MSTYKSLVWHKGTGIDVTGMSVDEQLKAADLDWPVKTKPVQYELDGKMHTVPKQFVAYREDTGAPLGIHADRKIWQNRPTIETFNRFCDTANLELHTVGSLKGGKSLYAAAKLDQALKPATEVDDLTDCYLLMVDSHELGKGMKLLIYMNRLVCTNGQTVAVRRKQRTISHVTGFSAEKLQLILEGCVESIQEQQVKIDGLANTQISDEEAKLQLIASFGNPLKAWDEQPRIVQTAWNLFKGQGMGANGIASQGTAYGLLQAATQEITHGLSNRGGAQQQFDSVLSGTRHKMAQKIQTNLVGSYVPGFQDILSGAHAKKLKAAQKQVVSVRG